MAKYYDYVSEIHITDTDIIVTSTYGSTQKSDRVARDGSEETNFKTTCNAHKIAFTSLTPSSTSPPCYVSVRGKWINVQDNATVTSHIATVRVPTGNSGKVKLYFEATSTGTMEYKIAAGSWTSFTTGTEITLTDGQTLTLRGLTMEEQEFINGVVTDSDTGVDLDSVSLMNNTPIP